MGNSFVIPIPSTGAQMKAFEEQISLCFISLPTDIIIGSSNTTILPLYDLINEFLIILMFSWSIPQFDRACRTSFSCTHSKTFLKSTNSKYRWFRIFLLNFRQAYSIFRHKPIWMFYTHVTASILGHICNFPQCPPSWESSLFWISSIPLVSS